MRRSTSSFHRGLAMMMVSLLAFANLAAAGQAQEASIIGQVTDESGAVLPGVTVTATSPALQVPQVTDVTNERGEYRLTPLPIGTYAVEYQLAGFGTVRRRGLAADGRVYGAGRRGAEGRRAGGDGHRVRGRARGGRDVHDRSHPVDERNPGAHSHGPEQHQSA